MGPLAMAWLGSCHLATRVLVILAIPYDEVTDLTETLSPRWNPLNNFGMILNFAEVIVLTNGTL